MLLLGTKGLDRNYVFMSDDWGKVTVGRQWSPYYSGSLGADWRGTIKGSKKSSVGSGGLRSGSYSTTSETSSKVIYNSPNISGLTVGVSFADGVNTTKADLKPAAGSSNTKDSGNTTYFEPRMNF